MTKWSINVSTSLEPTPVGALSSAFAGHVTGPAWLGSLGVSVRAMTEYDTISTETWRVHLPSDWSERECSAEHTAYFESADGAKGAYFSTWCFRDDTRSVREILESFRRIELRTLHEMKDSAWQSVDEWSSDNPQLSVLGADFLDQQAHYRIA